MKKNNKGFFLAETIIVLALVTTVMAFVYPNVSKLYNNYNSRIKYYDQTEDVLLLKEIYKTYNDIILDKTKGCCGDVNIINEANCNSAGKWMQGAKRFDDELEEINIDGLSKLGINKLYITGYMDNPTQSDYNFKRYLNRMRKVTNDTGAYRLIGVFKSGDEVRYASIKIEPETRCGING